MFNIDASGVPHSTGSADYRRADGSTPVTVTDIDMTIGSMCRFMVKWAIASLPAAFLLFLIFFIVTLVFEVLVRGVFR